MGVDILIDAVAAVVVVGGTDAPTAGTVQTWTVTTEGVWPVVPGVRLAQFRAMDAADVGDLTDYEVVLVTVNANGTSVSWTVERGVDGTTPTVHLPGFTLVPVASAGGLDNHFMQLAPDPYTASISGPTLLDFDNGPLQDLTLTASATLTLANLPLGGQIDFTVRGNFTLGFTDPIAWQPSTPVYDGTRASGTSYSVWSTETGEVRGAAATAIPSNTYDAFGTSAAETTRAEAAEVQIGSVIFGDGSDLTHTFDGTTVILGMTPSGSVYTLPRDIFLADGSIVNSGVEIKLNAHRLFCAGNLVNNGHIDDDGNAGGNGSSGVGGSAGAALSNGFGSINNSTRGKVGVAGVTTAAGGAAGTAQTLNALGAAGGNGGSSVSGANAGGTGGAVTALANSTPPPRALPWAVSMQTVGGGGSIGLLYGGASGGAGAGDGTNGGGGSGSGGGTAGVFAKTISGTGTISANGGPGGNATAGNAGGGGGGGGGLVVVVSRSVNAGVITGQTITATGGAPGTSSGTGGVATAGSPGAVILIPA